TLPLSLAALLARSLLASLAVTRNASQLVAQPLYSIERGFDRLLRIVSLLRQGAHGLLRVMQTFFEALHSRGDFRLHAVGVRIDAAAHPVRAALNARAQIGLLHVAERFPKFGGGGALILSGQFACSFLQIFFQASEVVREFLPIVGQFPALLRSRLCSHPLPEGLLNATGLVAFFLSESAGFFGERIDFCW